MARLIKLRSPFFIKADNTGHTTRTLTSATVDISVSDTSTHSNTPTQTLSKSVVGSQDYLIFEIAEIIRSEIEVKFDGTYSSPIKYIRATLTRSFDSGDDVEDEYNYFGLDGREDFDAGMQYEDGTTAEPADGEYLGSYDLNGSTDFVLQGVEDNDTRIPVWDATNNEVDYSIIPKGSTGSTFNGVKFTVRDEPHYEKRDVVKITFVSKNGTLQDIFASRRHTINLEAKSDMYYRNIVDYDTMTYDQHRHSAQKYNVTAYRNITVETDFLRDDDNKVIEDMFLSETVWITRDGNTVPVILEDTNVSYKTSVNDKLAQYKFKFKYANRVTNTIR